MTTPHSLEHALLGFLRREPLHAYEIHQTMLATEELGLVWRLKQSNLYALLARLEDAGYIESETEPQGTRPPRKLLSLTAQGRDAFERWVTTPVEHGREFRLEFLSKLYFVHPDDPAVAMTLIGRQRRACQEWLEELRAQAALRSAGSPYDWLVYEFRAGQTEAILTWLDTCGAALPAEARR